MHIDLHMMEIIHVDLRLDDAVHLDAHTSNGVRKYICIWGGYDE